MSWVSDFIKNTAGAVAIEGAILFPVLATMGFGIVDLSLMVLENHKMEQGLVAGASYLARAETPSLLIPQAKNIALSGRPDGSGQARVSGWSAADINLSIRSVPNTGQYRGDKPVQVAELSSNYEYSGLGFLRLVTGGKLQISSTHQERMVGAR